MFLNVSNEKVENILDSLQDISEKAKVSFFPHEVVTLKPPNEKVSEQIKNITEIGINLSGTLTFRFSGLTSSGVRFKRGKKKVFYASLITTIVLSGSLLTIQLWKNPYLQRSTKSKKVLSDIKEIINKNPDIKPVEVQVRFTRADIKSQNTLLCIIYLQKNNNSNNSNEEIKTLLKDEIRTVIRSKNYNVTPLIDITVFD